jgi:hypothetical protein
MTNAVAVGLSQDNNGGAVAPFVAGKNKIINGDFYIWQRGTTFSPTSAAQIYLADRWAIYQNGSGNFTVSQQPFPAGTAPVTSYENAYFIRLALTTLGTTSAFEFEQKIEDVRNFAGQTVTVSFWAKSPTSTGISFYFRQNFGTSGSSSVQSSTQSYTLTAYWQRFTYTVTLAPISGKTIVAGNSLEVVFNASTSANQTWDIWGVQVEQGSVATAFQTATGTLQGELAACQRYYLRYTASEAYTAFATGVARSSQQFDPMFYFPVQMRIKPSAVDFSTLSSIQNYSGAATSVTAVAINTGSPSQVQVVCTSSSTGLTQNSPYYLAANNSSNAYVGFSAEL